MDTFGLEWVSPAYLNLPRWNESRCLGGSISIALPYCSPLVNRCDVIYTQSYSMHNSVYIPVGDGPATYGVCHGLLVGALDPRLDHCCGRACRQQPGRQPGWHP